MDGNERGFVPTRGISWHYLAVVLGFDELDERVEIGETPFEKAMSLREHPCYPCRQRVRT